MNPEVRSNVEATVAALEAALGSAAEGQRQAIQRTAELEILASEYRRQALHGVEIDVGDLAKLETLAHESRLGLGVPQRKFETQKLVVEFVDSPERTADLRGENERLQATVAQLKAELAAARGEQVPSSGNLVIPDQCIERPALPKPPEPPAQNWDGLLTITRNHAPGISYGPEYGA
jgi:hypothetical protein